MDLISRQGAIDALADYIHNVDKVYSTCKLSADDCRDAAQSVLDDLSSSQPYTIHSDGRLWITVDDIDKVTAVVVDEHKSKFCKQFYEDAQPKRGKWILDRSGAYCCSECMEPCAGYVMMKPRDKFCKMCGSRNEVAE